MGPFFPDYRPANLKKLEGGRNKVFSWGFRAFLALAIDVRSRINSSVLFYLPTLLSFHIRTVAYRYKIVRLFVGFSVLLGFVTFNFVIVF